MAAILETADGLDWYDGLQLGLEGKGFEGTLAPYDRLPARAQGVVPAAVWDLSRNCPGMALRFWTDSPTIRARWRVTSSELGMANMPASGVSGLDLYGRLDGRWQWAGATTPRTFPDIEATLADELDPPGRDYMLYTPLLNSLVHLRVGVKSGCTVRALAPRPGPVVFYGTSIVHGLSASRPGMTHSAILGRRLDVPVINLGFSGNARMDAEVVPFLVELPARAYVIDCLPNMSKEHVAERTEPLVTALRAAHPAAPILLVEDRTWATAPFRKRTRDDETERRAALAAAFARLQAAGVTGLFYQRGEALLGEDNLGTVDASHPTDLGFMRQADATEPILARMLGM